MTSSAHDSRVTLDLGPEEAWVLHASLLDYLEREADAGNPAPAALSLLRTLERATSPELDLEGLRLVQTVLVEYMGDAPLRDRATCRAILARVRGSLEQGEA